MEDVPYCPTKISPRGGNLGARGASVRSAHAAGDVPLIGDFDGNGTNEAAVYRPSTGFWHIRSGLSVHYGTQGDLPVLHVLNRAVPKQLGVI